MATLRRRASYNYGLEAGSKLEHRHPDTLYPPEGYCMLECDLHRATTPLQVSCAACAGKCSGDAVMNCARSRSRSGMSADSLLLASVLSVEIRFRFSGLIFGRVDGFLQGVRAMDPELFRSRRFQRPQKDCDCARYRVPGLKRSSTWVL